nr:MAG TPA: hypothetical protein [Caudoviricetes sp.]
MCSMRCDESLKYHPVLQRKWSGGATIQSSPSLVVCIKVMMFRMGNTILKLSTC